MRFAVVLIWLNLCGTSGGRVGDRPPTPHPGPGWALHIPPVGARVQVEPARIAVDATDYSRWFDVRWEDAFEDLSLAPRNLAGRECDPVVWDEPVITEDTWTAGGLCTRQSRFHWLIARVERHGDRALSFFYVANPDFVAYEDAWVDFSGTAATLRPGSVPATPPDSTDLRRRIREAARNVPPGISPLPGGRVLSTAIIPKLTPVWELRATAGTPPARLDGSTP